MKQTAIFRGTIVGSGHRVECKVRATKTTLDESAPPAFSNYRIMNSHLTDNLPDGDYEVLVNGERIRVKHQDGHFVGRP
jgi:hypothetical protein